MTKKKDPPNPSPACLDRDGDWLVGKKIVDVCAAEGINGPVLAIELDDGTTLFPQSDAEGNDDGVVAFEHAKLKRFGQLYVHGGKVYTHEQRD